MSQYITAADSAGRARSGSKLSKARKAYPTFPLTPYASGSWQKKIRGKVHYCGRWKVTQGGKQVRVPGDDWKDAFDLSTAQADDLHAGRVPRNTSSGDGGLTLAWVCDHFLTAKLRRVQNGELSARTLEELRQTCERLVAAFGKKRLIEDLMPEDYAELRAKISETCSPVRLGNEIVRARIVFKYAKGNRLIAEAVAFGTEFTRPRRNTLRTHRAAGGKKLFTADEIHRLAKAASPAMRAAIYLGVNCGLGNTDVSALSFERLDLESGWLRYPRPKTGVDRRLPLWSETIKVLREAIEQRSKPKSEEAKDVVLLNARGLPFIRLTERSRTDGITTGFGLLLKKLKINGRRALGFYSLRHAFATIGLRTGERDAVKSLMGPEVLRMATKPAPAEILVLEDALAKHADRQLVAYDRVAPDHTLRRLGCRSTCSARASFITA